MGSSNSAHFYTEAGQDVSLNGIEILYACSYFTTFAISFCSSLFSTSCFKVLFVGIQCLKLGSDRWKGSLGRQQGQEAANCCTPSHPIPRPKLSVALCQDQQQMQKPFKSWKSKIVNNAERYSHFVKHLKKCRTLLLLKNFELLSIPRTRLCPVQCACRSTMKRETIQILIKRLKVRRTWRFLPLCKAQTNIHPLEEHWADF